MKTKARSTKHEARNKKGFTTKRAEQQMSVCTHLFEASAGRKAVFGFTLVETLIAITILTFAVSGSFLAANSAIVSASIARDKLIASSLAQEGVECVRKVRDDFFLDAHRQLLADVSGTAWANFLSSPLAFPDGMTCVGSGTYADSPPTVFTRTLSADGGNIASTVSWNFHNIQYSVSIADQLTPWK